MYKVETLIIVSSVFVVGFVSLGHADQPTVTIGSATYSDVDSLARSCNFKNKLNCTKDTRQCDAITIENDTTCSDPAQGGLKEGTITYTCNWNAPSLAPFFRPVKKTIVVGEHGQAHVSCIGDVPLAVYAETIAIIDAKYGDLGTNRTCDFMPAAQARCDGATACGFEAHGATGSLNFLCGDPAQGSPSKRAMIRFSCKDPVGQTNFRVHTAVAGEHDTLRASCPASD
jgi:hypothetical protein